MVILAVAFIAFAYFMGGDIFNTMNSGWLLAIGFGHYVDQATWDNLVANYNLLKGRVWVLFLLIEFLTPLIITIIQR